MSEPLPPPKRPRPGTPWVRCVPVPGLDGEIWDNRHGLRVISSVGTMEAPDSSGEFIPTWLVSCAREGHTMPENRDLKRVVRDFDLRGADEDNHENGIARKLFLPVDPSRRVACECKTDERVITRSDGYRYSVPLKGETVTVTLGGGS